MDVEKLMDIVAGQDIIDYYLVTPDGFSAYNKIDMVGATILGDTVEIMGMNGYTVEIPIATIKSVEYMKEDDAILINTDQGAIRLHSEGMFT